MERSKVTTDKHLDISGVAMCLCRDTDVNATDSSAMRWNGPNKIGIGLLMINIVIHLVYCVRIAVFIDTFRTFLAVLE